MSKIEVDTIDKQSGSTLTLGGSGTTVTLGSGATQSGFGRLGSVNWQSSIKTASFTAVSGEGYFVNTTSGAVTVTLPASPSSGDIVAIKDYANTFHTNNVTLGRNSSNIGGVADDATILQKGIAVSLVYADATKGWLVTESGLQNDAPHSYTVDFLVIAGGGGGGGTDGNNNGGGGAGGYRNSYSTESSGANSSSETSASFLQGSIYTITVGAGGTDGGSNIATNGNDSSISGDGLTTITSLGGGRGGEAETANTNGGNGGSGGGAGFNSTTGGSGTANQGLDGASGLASAPSYSGGGGGGAGVAGTQGANPSTKPAGGNGLASSITGSSVTRAGGGGGGHQQDAYRSPGGTGGGGDGGGNSPNVTGTDGTANTGSGGGGSRSNNTGGSGGSGLVILRMATANYTGTTTGSPTVTTDSTDTILTFNSSGSYTA